MFKIEDWSVIFFLLDSNHRNSSGTTQMYWITIPWNLRHLISRAVSDWELNDREMLRYLLGRLWRISIWGWQLSSPRTADVFLVVASARPKNRGRERSDARNTSAVLRLTTQWLYLIYFIGCFLVLRMRTVTKWLNTKEWKYTEQLLPPSTKAKQQLPQHQETAIL